MPNRIRPDKLIRFHTVDKRSTTFSRKLGKLRALDAFRFTKAGETSPSTDRLERFADQLKPIWTPIGRPNDDFVRSSRLQIKYILQGKGAEIKANETPTVENSSIRQHHRHRSSSRHLKLNKSGQKDRIGHESDLSGPTITRVSTRRSEGRKDATSDIADSGGGQVRITAHLSGRKPAFKPAARPPSGIPMRLRRRLIQQALVNLGDERYGGVADLHLVRRLKSEKHKKSLVRRVGEHEVKTKNSHGEAKRDIEDLGGEVQGQVQNRSGKSKSQVQDLDGGLKEQTLGTEISIASALASHHSDNLGSATLGQITSADHLQSKLSTTRRFRSVAKKSVPIPKSFVLTKVSSGPPRKGKSPALSGRGRRRLEYIRRTQQQSGSQGEIIGLKAEMPNAAKESFSEHSLQPQISNGSEDDASPNKPSLSRDDFSQINRENIPFEDTWFDDIRQEQPPAMKGPSPSLVEYNRVSYFKGGTYVAFRELKPTMNISDSPGNRQKSSGGPTLHQTSSKPSTSGNTKKPLPSPEQIVHNTLTTPPVLGETPNEAVLKAIQKLSLRAELFPGDLYPLPPKPPVPDQNDKNNHELPHMPFKFNPLATADSSDARPTMLSYGTSSRFDPVAVLILETASTALCDDDFQRLTLKGKHIEEWQSAGGSVQVIPVRHPETLFHRKCYFLFFPNIDLARTYRDRVQEIHRIARTYTPTSIQSPMPPPPGMLVDGQNVHRLMQDFTLCPPGLELHINLFENPRGMSTKEVIANRGYLALDPPNRPRRSGRSVIFWLKWYQPTTTAVFEFLTKDGRARGLPWGPMDGRGSVERLQDAVQLSKGMGGMPYGDEEPDEEELKRSGEYETGEQQGSRELEAGEYQHARWLISFEDENEARRFVRTWHQRPWPGIVGSDISWEYEDSTPLVQAEFLI